MSYVVRPSSSASDACTSALICSPDSASQNGRSQPAYSKSPSCSLGPPLAWITPSSVMFMLTCSSPIAPAPHHSRRAHPAHVTTRAAPWIHRPRCDVRSGAGLAEQFPQRFGFLGARAAAGQVGLHGGVLVVGAGEASFDELVEP